MSTKEHSNQSKPFLEEEKVKKKPKKFQKQVKEE
jgi:hypothetical protein